MIIIINREHSSSCVTRPVSEPGPANWSPVGPCMTELPHQDQAGDACLRQLEPAFAFALESLGGGNKTNHDILQWELLGGENLRLEAPGVGLYPNTETEFLRTQKKHLDAATLS